LYAARGRLIPFNRAELAKVMKRLERDDLLIVTRLDRLARSTRDLLNILHALADKGAKFKSLHDPWCDTSTPQGELLVTILAGFATFERHLIKARTDAGRKRAMARGVRFGRPRKLDAHQRQEALERLANGETLIDVARTYAVDPTTIGRLLYNGA
jgi:DNA invertase Pin-like site-specific DNA recombinase